MEVAVEAAQGAAERERPSEEASCGEGAEHRRAKGDQLKKLVKPVEKRRTVDHLRESRGMSLRLSCGLVGMSRSSYAYRSSRDDSELLDPIKEKALERKRWGYRRLHVLVRREGHEVNLKRTYRIYRDAGLQVRRRKRKRHRLARVHEIFESSKPNQRWSMDFVHDSTWKGRRMRMLAVVDDHTKRCLWIEVDSSISGHRVSRILDNLVELHGKPE